jgi:hypothetical protein
LLLHGAKVVATLASEVPAVAATRSVSGADSLGFVLTTLRQPPPARGGVSEFGRRDSVELVRVARSTARADTIARLRMTPTSIRATANAKGEPTSVSVRRNTLTVGEEALLFADGSVAVVRLDPYRVDWRAPNGRWTFGAALPAPVIKVNAREKRAHMDRTAKASGQPVKSPDTITDWPETLPPYVSNSLLPSSDGRLLILRQRTSDHEEQRYDVVNRRGVLDGQLTLPENERIVGFGAHSVYVAVTDSDGIQRLRRHPWP